MQNLVIPQNQPRHLEPETDLRAHLAHDFRPFAESWELGVLRRNLITPVYEESHVLRTLIKTQDFLIRFLH